MRKGREEIEQSEFLEREERRELKGGIHFQSRLTEVVRDPFSEQAD